MKKENFEIYELLAEVEALLEQPDFTMLTKQMATTSVLTPEEERRMFENFESARGQKKVHLRNDIVKSNLKLVSAIANRWYKRSVKATGVAENTLFQEGILGLIKAVERFDWRRGRKFSTFATPKVEGAIRDFLKSEFKRSKIEEPEEAKAAGKEGQEIVSKIDRFIGQRSRSPEEKLIGQISIKQLIARLPKKEGKIIQLRYLDGLTLEKIGRIVGLSTERVSQLEKRALKKMKGMV
jgi:RNA polymerase sigma factor (sigma-70 family)